MELKVKRGVSLMLGALVGALALVQSSSSYAQSASAGDEAALSDAFSNTKGYETFPKPWPLRNLITPGTLTVGMTGASKPKEFIDVKTGELTGSSVSIYKKIAADLGLKIDFVKVEWPAILPGLAANRFDMGAGGCSWTPERLSSPDFLLTTPHQATGSVGVATVQSGITEWSQTDGKLLGMVRGEVESAGGYDKLVKDYKVKPQQTFLPGGPEVALALNNNQVDFTIVQVANAKDMIAHSNGRLRMFGPVLGIFFSSLCVNPREPDLAQAANVLIGNYRADGSIEELVKKFGGNPADVQVLKKLGY